MEKKISDGLIVIDKPSGLSSFLAVKIAARAVGAKKAGHMGTLDPLASGVLPVLPGRLSGKTCTLHRGKRPFRYLCLP